MCSGCENVMTKDRISMFKHMPDHCHHCGSPLRQMTDREIEDMISDFESKQHFTHLENMANGY